MPAADPADHLQPSARHHRRGRRTHPHHGDQAHRLSAAGTRSTRRRRPSGRGTRGRGAGRARRQRRQRPLGEARGEGDLALIPGSMGTRSYVVRGKGNPESFQSASHGAGRRMSRTAAKKR
ncbi:RtcB family protein, partial [Nocardia cyriacigeorgica]|uniref:RtcB family protein n=1 Tax=Nocardia cyriacigeorgica TaxID=135487 RepID=UPI002454D045